MVRQEYGSSWGGDPIEYIVETGDQWLSDNIWVKAVVRAFKLVAKRGDVDLDILVYGMLNTARYTITDF
jgi:hypothetical protein